jgi:hypothetical protein
MSAPRVHHSAHGVKAAPIRQLASHRHLLNDVSHALHSSARARRGPLDAIIVPTARRASALTGLMELAAQLKISLVVLCSQQANFTQVAERMGRVGARGIAVGLDDTYALPHELTKETSSDVFFKANGARTSDLSVKRNSGLLLAKLRGWRKIAFVDDDITLSARDLGRIADQLDNQQFAGMMCRDFPDNSVLCHARRLAKLPQDVFVTGAVLGVHCADLPLPFFPDIYNEDWFFFSEAAAHHRLTKVGEARQAAYDPYVESRACHEEFGDLLAEGLYSAIGTTGTWCKPGDFYAQITNVATERYWASFIEVRREDLWATRARLEEFLLRDDCGVDVVAAIKALNAADALYDNTAIDAARCVEFLDSWVTDTTEWNTIYARTGNLAHVRDAMDWLQMTHWEEVR